MDSIVYSKEVIEFVTVANSYCSFIENSSTIKTNELADKLLKLLSFLYLKASTLPGIELTTEESEEKFVSEIEWTQINNSIFERLQELDTYDEFINPITKMNNEQFVGSIAENIADIYQDLKDFLCAYRVGNIEVMTAALFTIKNSFENYWGQSLLNGLKSLHFVFYNREFGEK